jgi:hypothetical protein
MQRADEHPDQACQRGFDPLERCGRWHEIIISMLQEWLPASCATQGHMKVSQSITPIQVDGQRSATCGLETEQALVLGWPILRYARS